MMCIVMALCNLFIFSRCFLCFLSGNIWVHEFLVTLLVLWVAALYF